MRAALQPGLAADQLQSGCVAAVGTCQVVFLLPGDLPEPHDDAAAVAVAHGWLLLKVEEDALKAVEAVEELPTADD